MEATPIPWTPVLLAVGCRTVEPAVYILIYAYIVQLLEEIGTDSVDVGYYAAILEGALIAAGAFTIIPAAWLSDKVGRKPVTIVCTLGVCMAGIAFGSVTTWPLLLCFRLLAGAFDAHTAVVRTMLAELSDESNEAVIFSIQEFVWAACNSIAPVIGGVLAHPAERYPSLFGRSRLFKARPYLLPPLVSTAPLVLCALLSICYMRETLQRRPKHYEAIPQDEDAVDGQARNEEHIPTPSDLPVFTRNVVLVLSSQFVLAAKHMAHSALLPVFAGAPVSIGGLGFSTSQISALLTFLAVLACLALGTQYPRLERHLGRLGVARFASISYVFAFPLLPILHHVRKAEISRHTDLPVERGYPVGPWTAAFSIFTVVPIILGSYQWANQDLLLTNAVANRAHLARVVAVGSTLINLGLLFGGSTSNALFSYSARFESLAGRCIVYLVCTAITLFGVGLAYAIDDTPGWRLEESKRALLDDVDE